MVKVTVSTQPPDLTKTKYYQAYLHWLDPITHKHKNTSKTTKVEYVDKKQKRLYNQAKKEADNRAEEIRKAFEEELNGKVENKSFDERQQILFSDYLQDWLKNITPTKAKSTIGGYSSNINAIICPYFKDKGIKLNELTTLDIQDFYDYQYNLGKSNKTVLNYHHNIHQALERARKTKLIPNNPAADCEVQRPKKFIPQVYNKKELAEFFTKVKDTDIGVPIVLICMLGIRRSEAIGLKTSRIDFEQQKLTIAHTVTCTTINHKRIVDKKDLTKNDSSYRTFPMNSIISNFLTETLRKQEENKKLYGNTYKNKEGYVCVKEDGTLINPDTLTKKFAKFIKDNNLKKCRIHDIRHSVGSILLNNGSNLREVQEWLGHSNVQTTEIYTHLDSSAKEKSSNIIYNIFADAC